MPLTPYFNAINKEISRTKYGEKPEELYEPISYIMSLGGKRMRPLLTLLAANIYTKNWKKAVKPAIAVEVFHNFTLMHDDIMDDAPLRRGKPTVHAKWNENIAILSGDVMLVNAYELLLDVETRKFKKVLKRFNRTAAEVCEGQQLDMNFETRCDVSEEEYLEMIKLKTAVLLGFSLELGGIIAGADESETQLLNEAGTNIGIGFQLKDDILDVYGDPEKFGKQVGGDIIENKKTFMLIEALSKASGETKKQLDYWLSLKEFDKVEKVKAVTEIYNTLYIKQLAEEKMNYYFKKGFEAFDKLGAKNEHKSMLINFAHQLIDRES
jgi:geranylgeranyl diphosphate synthase, type II